MEGGVAPTCASNSLITAFLLLVPLTRQKVRYDLCHVHFKAHYVGGN